MQQHFTSINSENDVKWRHCRGAWNPADLASRGFSGGVLCRSDWFDGPTWLKNRDSWPVMFCPKVNGEVLQTFHHPSLFVNTVVIPCRWWERLSRWPLILGFGAPLLQWKYGKTESRSDLLDRSEVLLYRIIQESLFSEDIAVLRQGKTISRSSKLFRLTPFLDDPGLLRVGGRLQNL